MSETSYNQARWITQRMSPYDFQMLCFFYLQDKGYAVSPGRMPGRDGGHDLYGTGPNGSFIGHCTTQQRGLLAKIRKDIVGGVSTCTGLPLPKAEILYFIQCDKSDVFHTPVDEENLKAALQSEICSQDARYQDEPPHILMVSGDSLAREVCSLGKVAYQHIRAQTIARMSGLEGDESLLLEDASANPSLSENDLLSIVSDYGDLLPEEIRRELMERLFGGVWGCIVHDPIVGHRLLSNEAICKGRFAPLLVPLCKISCHLPVAPTELQAFLETLWDQDFRFGNHRFHQHHLLIGRMIRHLLYHQPQSLGEEHVQEQLQMVVNEGDMFWAEYFTDLYLRHSCGYIGLQAHLQPFVNATCHRYLNEHSDTPLARLFPIITAPLQAALRLTISDLIEDISSVAADARNDIQCKWCILALLRTAPLLASSEEELDFSSLVPSLIDSFDGDIASGSSNIQFTYLRSLLNAFVRTREVHFLSSYENRFLRYRSILIGPQIAHLQTEYASCLYTCCQFLDTQALTDLRFGKLTENGTNPITHGLFANELLKYRRSLGGKLSLSNRASLFKWLLRYLKLMFALDVERRLEENHNSALVFPAARGVYHLRELFGPAVLSSLIQHANHPPFAYKPPFYAKSAAAFEFVSRMENIDLMMEYLSRGLEADQYSVARNAKDAAKCLYWCSYYGPSDRRNEVENLMTKLAETTGIGQGMPRFHWAYYAGMHYQDRPIEKSFLNDLWTELSQTTRKADQLALRRDETFSVTFSTAVLDLVRNYCQQGSLFAMLLSTDELRNPELWNVLGTTVFNNRREDDHMSAMQASRFYSFAKCFSRTRNGHDQKYCYNYIRCRSLAYEVAGMQPDDFYVLDVCRYLSKAEASQFRFKEEATGPYFDSLQMWWENIPDEIRLFIVTKASDVWWVKPQLRRRGLLT